MSSGLGTTQPALPPASDQEMQREKNQAPARSCPEGKSCGRAPRKDGCTHPHPYEQWGGKPGRRCPRGTGGLWGMKQIQSTHPVL